MSYTEIYGFNKKGTAYLVAQIHNSWRGAIAIWRILEEKYLPPYIPDYIKCCYWYRPNMAYDELVRRNGFIPKRTTSLSDETALKEIWDLVNSEKVTRADKIILATTFDFVIVRKVELPEVIKVFNDFEGETSLKEQAEFLGKMYEGKKCIAVGWNQTSVNAETWADYEYDEEKDESIPYNLNKYDKHWYLFDELDEWGQK